MAEKQNNYFKAKINVNTIVALIRYPEIKEDINKRLDQIALDNPDGRRAPSAMMANRLLHRGQTIQFGDKLELNENGHVLTYPKELFEQYSKRIIEMPCQMQGNVTKMFDETIQRMTAEDAEEYEQKRDIKTARFLPTPIMELVKE